ncbi:MAG: 3-oxoacyl-[acyl-carrier-protein] reductase [Alphaproteobacteria bacterium]|jgi:3-oxoacyl-[acyl-carrier protein] reductase|nr:3-oxoacyl-[acyl-carrier-protein] reductase [Alphaproteobacteria bacterium]
MFSLDGKKVLLTGAAGGLGMEIARALSTQGATLVLSGTRKEALEALASELPRAHTALCRLDQAEEVNNLVANAETLVGEIDILVNNAGITRDGLALRMKDEDFQAVLDVNLKAAFMLIRASLKGMMKRRWGRIINISSVVGVTGNPGQANYCAAKAGLIGMSKSLAQEVATRGITVNCVAPGFMTSAMTEVLPDAQKEALLKSIPMGAMGSGQDIGAAVCFLASQEAGYITGQTLHVNGGLAMI